MFAFRWKKKHRTPKMTNQRCRNAIVINNTLESVLSQTFIYHIKTKHRRYELVAIISTFHSMDIDFITTLKQFSIYIHGTQWAKNYVEMGKYYVEMSELREMTKL